MRRAAKVDENQAQIVEALRKQGAHVVSLAALGGGVPDLICTYKGVTFLLEVKVKNGELTEAQERFWSAWYGAGGRHLHVVRSEAEALAVVLGEHLR